MPKILPLIISLFLLTTGDTIAQWQSSRALMHPDGYMVYPFDTESNRIPDFSYAGYKNGDVPIPTAEIVQTLGPQPGDNTERINNALARHGVDCNRYKDEDPVAVLLRPGRYRVSQIVIKKCGIVLRGSGRDNTTLFVDSDEQDGFGVVVGNGGYTRWSDHAVGRRHAVLDNFVPVGSNELQVEEAEAFKAGQDILVVHDCSDEWLDAIDSGMGKWECDGEYGDSQLDLVSPRTIRTVNYYSDSITLDAPLFYQLDSRVTNDIQTAHVVAFSWPKRVRNVGVEGIAIEMQSDGPLRDHRLAGAVYFREVEDAWLRDSRLSYFRSSGVATRTARRLTIERNAAVDPHSVITGGNRYNFNIGGWTHEVLVKDNYSENGRHSFVVNAGYVGPSSGVVFHNNHAARSWSASESHQGWAQGVLYDNHKETAPSYSAGDLMGRRRMPFLLFGLYNRASYSAPEPHIHGWAAVHSVGWNVDLSSREYQFSVMKPPTGQNYMIGYRGRCVPLVRFSPVGHHEPSCDASTSLDVTPPSLYLAQLADRSFDISINGPARLENEEVGEWTVVFSDGGGASSYQWFTKIRSVWVFTGQTGRTFSAQMRTSQLELLVRVNRYTSERAASQTVLLAN